MKKIITLFLFFPITVLGKNSLSAPSYVYTIMWFVGLIIIWLYYYFKHNKSYHVEFNEKYLRDFPTDYPPEYIEYLMEHKVTKNGLVSSLLNIIRKGGLVFEKIVISDRKSGKKRKDYKLIKVSRPPEKLTDQEQMLMDWFLIKFGDRKSFYLSSLKAGSMDYYKAKEFIREYERWNSAVVLAASKEQFFEDKNYIKSILKIYTILPILMFMLLDFDLSSIIAIIAAILFSFYLSKALKRTSKGNLYYKQYKAIKRFLNDFGRFREKEIPEIYLWEKYLVFATLFGIADKIFDEIEIELSNIKNKSGTTFNDLQDINVISKDIIVSIDTMYENASLEEENEKRNL